MTLAQLNGFFSPDYPAGQVFSAAVGTPPPGAPHFPPVEIRDARALQARTESEAACFAAHGFALLPHASAVRDWDNEVAALYLPEIEAVIRERLLPGRRLEIQQSPFLVRRGRGTGTPYANGVHQDHGLTAGDYENNVTAFAGAEIGRRWRRRFDREDVAGFMAIDFWCTTNMAGPLRHMPLALCDPNSVGSGDLVPTRLTGIAPDGQETHHLALRYNDKQAWYHYPEMTGDELLAFKIFQCGADGGGPLASCLHSAFVDPGTPADAEERQSCEHRVGVLLLRD
ncbi:MAG: hypothetical protein JO276_01490 [Sphingomonadaceae bacterium]|nr:hypothetical protein [Sphingomonadaceae bacterium]